VDAAGTSILQASQLLAYIGLFRPRVLILDEPDSHLHPDNQRALCELICRVAGDRGFQALISTHSRHVLDAMSGRATVAWLSKGRLIDEPKTTTTAMLLDLGALDSVDYFAQGGLRCVVATEDTEKSALRALLWSNGFVEAETEIASYSGCSKVDSAIVLARFLKEKAPQLSLVIHRDADYMDDETRHDFCEMLEGASTVPFVTEGNDIESYFINAEHLAHLNPPLDVTRIRGLIAQATADTKKSSLEALVNNRAEFAHRAARGRRAAVVNHGEIATRSHEEYEKDPSSMRRGKLVLGRVLAEMQRELKSNPRVFHPSEFLRNDTLRGLASRIWNPQAKTGEPDVPTAQEAFVYDAPIAQSGTEQGDPATRH
jgi:hypothetical protein